MKSIYWMSLALLVLGACGQGEIGQTPEAVTRQDQPPHTEQDQPLFPEGREDEFSQECLSVWPAVVEIEGTLETEERLGPPGYGESPDKDMPLTIYVLALEESINVCADLDPDQPRPIVMGAERIQLTEADPAALQALVGSRIKARGSLTHAVWGTDFTGVVLRVNSVGRISDTLLRQSTVDMPPGAAQLRALGGLLSAQSLL